MRLHLPLIMPLCILLTTAFAYCSKGKIRSTMDVPVEGPAKKAAAAVPLASGPGDVVGKLVVGYQGWFSCGGDGSPNNRWVHWGSSPGGLPPSPGHQTFELWPDVRDYSSLFQTGYASLGNGQAARLFSSWTTQTVNTHFLWMQQYGIDCAALQRFGKSTPQKDGIAGKVMAAAQTYGRKFYVMYDISGWTNFQSEIKTDWTSVIAGTLNLTSSAAYAKQNGKPVVCVWGVGVAKRPGDVNSWSDVLNWFKGQGCYVIVGGPGNWRSQTANLPAFGAANMIMPWATGTFNGIAGADNYASTLAADLAWCNAHGLDYQAEVFPGFAWSNWNGGPQNAIPRLHGDFMWEQFANIRNQGISNVYVGMFDEYDEATAIAKAAEDASMKPADQYFLTLDADGVHVSADFYLRVTGDGAKMIKGQTPLVWAHPAPHVLTPPASLTPHVLSGSSIQVNWSAVTGSPCYNLKRSTTSGGPYTVVAPGVAGGGYTDTGLAPNTTYYYVVSSGFINGSESANSFQVSAKTNP